MNYTDNLGARCDLMPHTRSPYPPRAWLELPNVMYPVVNDPERCRRYEEETKLMRQEQMLKVEKFHQEVCDRIRKLSGYRDCDLAEPPFSRPPPECEEIVHHRSRSFSPELEFLERLPPAHTLSPICSAPRLPRSASMSDESRKTERLKCVRSTSAVRDREQARQWRDDTAKKQHLAEIRRRQRCLERLREEALLEEQRMHHLKSVEDAIVERESKLYATELKRLVATRMLRHMLAPSSTVLTTPYDVEHPFGLTVLPVEVRKQLRRLPPLCPCAAEWWETNPDTCQCGLRGKWTECAHGLEKLMSISVHGSHCF